MVPGLHIQSHNGMELWRLGEFPLRKKKKTKQNKTRKENRRDLVRARGR